MTTIESLPFGRDYILKVSDRGFIIEGGHGCAIAGVAAGFLPVINVVVPRPSMLPLFEVLSKIMAMPERTEPFSEQVEIINPHKKSDHLIVSYKKDIGPICAILEVLTAVPVKPSEVQTVPDEAGAVQMPKPPQPTHTYQRRNNQVFFRERVDIYDFFSVVIKLLPYVSNPTISHLFGLLDLTKEVGALQPEEEINKFFEFGHKQRTWLMQIINEKLFPHSKFPDVDRCQRKRKKFLFFVRLHLDLVKMSLLLKKNMLEL